MKTFKELLIKLDACHSAIELAEDKDVKTIVETCHRGDWLLWLALKVGVEKRPLTLTKARCAKTVIHLMKDKRSIDAVNLAERYGLGDGVTDTELAASDAANAAADADVYATYATYAAAAYANAYAATAAAHAAYAADAYAYAANAAAYAVDANACVANAAANAAATAAYAYAYDAAYVKNKQETADICREIIGKIIINKVNVLLNQNT